MAAVVDGVEMGDCLVPVGSLVHRVMLDAHLLDEDVDSHEFVGLAHVSFLADAADDALFFLHFGDDGGDGLCSFE